MEFPGAPCFGGSSQLTSQMLRRALGKLRLGRKSRCLNRIFLRHGAWFHLYCQGQLLWGFELPMQQPPSSSRHPKFPYLPI